MAKNCLLPAQSHSKRCVEYTSRACQIATSQITLHATEHKHHRFVGQCGFHPLMYADRFAHATPSNQTSIQGQAFSVGMTATHLFLLSPVLPPMQDKKKYERARELLYLEDQFNIAKRVVSDEQCHACCTQMCCVSVRRRQRCQA